MSTNHIGIGRSTADLARIAAAGSGYHLNPIGRSTDDLIQIAAAANQGGATITILGTVGRTTDELIRIGQAAKGHVVFASKAADWVRALTNANNRQERRPQHARAVHWMLSCE